jgi:hypothetical protein
LPGRKSSLQIGNARSSSFSQKTEVDAGSITNDSRLQVVNSPLPIHRQSSLSYETPLPNRRWKQSRNNTNEDFISSKSRNQVDVAHVVLACVAIRASLKKSRSFSWTVSRPLCDILFGPTSPTVRPVVCARRVFAALWERESTCVNRCRMGYQEIFPGLAAPSRNARTGVGSPPGVFEHGSKCLVFRGYALPSCTIIKHGINSSFSLGL